MTPDPETTSDGVHPHLEPEPVPVSGSACPHCASGTPHDHELFVRSVDARYAALGRRAATRCVFAALLLGIVVVLGARDGDLGRQSLTSVGGAVAWALAVAVGLVLGALLARTRSAGAIIALSATCAAGATPLLAWLLAVVVPPASLAPLAAAAGWFAASSAAEAVRARATRRLLHRAGADGDATRARESRVTAAQDAREERRAVLTAGGFALATWVATVLPPLTLVLAPLAAATAAVTSIRDRRGTAG